MRKTIFLLLIFTIIPLVFLCFIPCIEAGECNYGTLHAWYSKDNITWENSTVHDAYLKRGQPFYIKAETTSKVDLMAMSLQLWETGIDTADDSVFQLIEGPNCFFHSIPFYNIKKDDTSTYLWKILIDPDTNWGGGNAPLNIRAQYNINNDESDEIYFTVANINIIDALWEGYTNNSNAENKNTINNNNTPGFELYLLITVYVIFLFCDRKRKQQN